MSSNRQPIFWALVFFSMLFQALSVEAKCVPVGDIKAVTISPTVLSSLSKLNMDREGIFRAIHAVSEPETSGCWAGASGNFDGQIVSVGVLQWNYGQNSLQPMIRRYREKFATEAAFRVNIGNVMPIFGKLIFSEGCRRIPITTDCQTTLEAQSQNGRLNSVVREEFDNLFNSETMIQIQVDRFIALVQSVSDDLSRIFPSEHVTSLKVKWAIDTKTQQGSFPGNADIARTRKSLASASAERKRVSIAGIVHWYEGLCSTIDQGGIWRDCSFNIAEWTKLNSTGAVSDEQCELLHFTFLRSRVAQGMSGYWQALSFQRRARIILGVGSVGGDIQKLPATTSRLAP